MNGNPLQLIADNYAELNAMMVKEIELATAHPGLTGSYREEMWVKFFRSIIPRKFSFVHGAMIIDSDGNISNEVDIAVIDEMYTPYIFQYHTLKLIPVEAVSLVIECKSTTYDPDALIEWAKNIEKLKAKNTGIARMATGYTSGVTNETQSRTLPIKVLVSIKGVKTDKTLDKDRDELGDHFDFIIQEKYEAASDRKMFKVLIKNEDKTLGWWANRLNNHVDKNTDGDAPNIKTDENAPLQVKHIQSEVHSKSLEDAGFTLNGAKHITNKLADFKIEENPLLSLNLQLNQLLMLLNNPMLFPHFAYAKAFQRLYKPDAANEKNE